jgi:hypothetical protein
MGKKRSNKERKKSIAAKVELRSELDSLLSALTSEQKSIEGSQSAIEGLVRDARLADATWPQIGHALGVTTQAAQQRFGKRISLFENSTELGNRRRGEPDTVAS